METRFFLTELFFHFACTIIIFISHYFREDSMLYPSFIFEKETKLQNVTKTRALFLVIKREIIILTSVFGYFHESPHKTLA